jgi:uncharacterized protein (TIGR02145 family)
MKSMVINQQKITIMKKLYYFFLLLPLWGFGGFAHASVTVQVLGTDFTNKTVTLRVEYANAVNDRVWVWIYLCSMQGMFQPAEISAASATNGSVLYLSTNTRGFFVTSSPATVTATLSNASGRFSCCAYGSDTPPNATAANGTYTFKGTPPFTLTDADGTTTQTVTENTLPASALTITPVILTDETGYSDVFDFCLYAGSDLFIDATHFCRQRTSGAQNWEAWILDSRDNELYRIVYMPDNKWWLAQNVRYAGTGSSPSANGRLYTAAEFNAAHGGSSGSGQNKQGVCPPGWVLPITSEWTTFHNVLGSSVAQRNSRIRSANASCTPINDYFGFANIDADLTIWHVNTGQCCWFRIDIKHNVGEQCDVVEICNVVDSRWCSLLMGVRCFRNL